VYYYFVLIFRGLFINAVVVDVINDELERIWKEVVVAKSRNAPELLAGNEEQEKSTVRIPGVRIEIRTDCLRNTSPERYRYGKLLGLKM
jgi:hypothetical protein